MFRLKETFGSSLMEQLIDFPLEPTMQMWSSEGNRKPGFM